MKKQLILLGIATMIVLSGCGNTNNDNSGNNTQPASQSNMPGMDHSKMPGMGHSSSGEVPAGLKQAANPTFPVGSQAIIKSDHMEGMNGAEATIVGAYDTTAYAVTYTPTTGGDPVKNHKWVIHEEIKDASDKPYTPGTEVVLEADHMPGMKGAKGVIDSAEHTTVYMVNFVPTTGGVKVTNHKWVTESELSAK